MILYTMLYFLNLSIILLVTVLTSYPIYSEDKTWHNNMATIIFLIITTVYICSMVVEIKKKGILRIIASKLTLLFYNVKVSDIKNIDKLIERQISEMFEGKKRWKLCYLALTINRSLSNQIELCFQL